MRPQGGVALQGQFLAGPRRVMGGTRGVWRGGTIADLCLPRVRVGCRGVRSGVDAHTNPGTSIGCNRTPRCRGEAKSWPYRPRGTFAPGSGIASRAGGTGLTGRNRKEYGSVRTQISGRFLEGCWEPARRPPRGHHQVLPNVLAGLELLPSSSSTNWALRKLRFQIEGGDVSLC
jgi:hypothetical protein